MYTFYKLKLVELNPKLKFTSLSGKEETCRQYEKILVGSHETLEGCLEAFNTYSENDENVFSFIIEGPEHGHGKIEYKYSEKPWPGEDEIRENEKYDESPEILLVYDADKRLISSYRYDNANPGGVRQAEEHIFHPGEKAWVKQTVYLEDSDNDLLMPVEIVGKFAMQESPETLNIEKDQLEFRPLTTVTANWGECPESPVDNAPRIDFLPYNAV